LTPERQTLITFQVTRDRKYMAVPISGGCKIKQHLLSLKKFPPDLDELHRQIIFKTFSSEALTIATINYDANVVKTATKMAIVSAT
jgi:hypothetical protein